MTPTSPEKPQDSRVGFVVIGRNEGQRLLVCLRSIPPGVPVVYVDSGSTDGSVEAARALGVEAVELDLSIPFTAARARNAGFARLIARAEPPTYVQFVDGDCELLADWTQRAVRFLDETPSSCAVVGRLRERFPDRSVYNRLCDMEWEGAPGEIRSCGGIAMYRVPSLTAVGGFREDLIAGEEPELCVRLRAAGFRLHRIDADMALHDAAMTRFSQWWRRAVRSGFAFAQGRDVQGKSPDRLGVAESRRIWVWGFAAPLAIVLAAVLVSPWCLLAFAIYPLRILRIALRLPRGFADNVLRATFLVVGSFPEFLGQLRFLWRKRRDAPPVLIEYK
jgi:glycosyltransferase involved in cell wall biosynthesis